MKRSTKKQRVVGTLSPKAWAQALEQFHRAEVEKWRKAEEQLKAEKLRALWDAQRQTFTDVQRELHAMLLRQGRTELYLDAWRILTNVREKWLERYVNEGKPEQRKEQSESSAKPGSGSLVVRSRDGKRSLRVRLAKAKG
jgi:hypothetical protein